MIGFSLMLIIDEVTKIIEAQRVIGDIKKDENKVNDYQRQKDIRLEQLNKTALLTTIALCVHSLAEGVAMGSSLFLGQLEDGASAVGYMVTLALFLHKAPEAASYGTFIVKCQTSFWNKIIYIAAYAISSPVSAFTTYAVFSAQS